MASNQEVEKHLRSALADRYRIEREIGRGGMATVYLAEDLKHHRQVAVKVLDPGLSQTLGAERFLREIETAANLTHPHILPLFDSGEADGFLFYVMPYVKGESLRARLTREKQLPVEDALQIAREIADALAYAHEEGVVHRDVKPANIMMEGGHAFLADFGVAQAVAGVDQTKLTQTGTSPGTPSYLSPEQAAGERELDGRSDQYALACVVYEMLVGEPPHTGSTAQAIIAKVLSTDPQPISEVRGAVPANVVAAVRKALEKVPADRFSGALEFADALNDPRFAVPTGVTTTPGQTGESRWKRLAIVASGLALVLAVVAGASIWKQLRTMRLPELASPPIRLPIGLGSFGGGEYHPAMLTPDCSGLVYFSEGQLNVQRLNERTPRSVPATSDARQVLISPDGRQVGHFQGDTGGRLWRVPIDGGQGVVIAEEAGSSPGWYGGSWGSDGFIYFTPDGASGIHRISVRGGEPEPVTTLDSVGGEVNHRFAQLLPGGRGLLYTIWYGDLESAVVGLTPMDTGESEIIGPGMGARYAPTGHLVYGQADGSLQAVPFDLGTLQVTGASVTVERDVFVTSYGDVRFSFCDEGVLAYQLSGGTLELILLSRDGRERSVDRGHDFSDRRFSPDGSRLAVSRPEAGGGVDIWVYNLDQGGEHRVTREGTNWNPVWSPDGEYLAFFSDRAGPYSLFRKRSDGSGSAELLLASDDHQFANDWSADGRWMLYHEGLADGGADRDLWLLPLDGGDPKPLVGTPARVESRGKFSPNSRYVAYESEGQVWVVDVEYRDSRIQVSVDGGGFPRWGPDGRELIYTRRDQDLLMVVSVETDPTFRIRGEERVLLDPARVGIKSGSFDVSPDGSQFAFLRRSETSRARFEVVTHWFGELTEKVGR